MSWKWWKISSPSLHELRNKLQFPCKDQRGHSRRWWWKRVWSHQVRFHPAVKDTAAGISAARSALSSPSVNRKVMPTQRCRKTLKFLSERRGWHLLSSADVPSRNTVQGQPTLLPRFLVQWNSSCHKTNLCKVRFVQTKKEPCWQCRSLRFWSKFVSMKSFVLGIRPLLHECKALSD